MDRLTLYVLCVSDVIISVASIEVQTTLGRVRGKLVQDETIGISYHAFEGIPYAEPPVGDLRFKPPVQKRAMCTVFDATKPGRVCPQIELYHSREEMDEDCLNFNIYTPANCSNNLLPVIFNIHDGNFNLQSGKAEPIYGPQLLIQNDLVVVTINYRLGALGFLSFWNEEVSGNAGVKDVLLALRIVHENIKNFGGDPNKITIRGNGAGAAVAELLMLTSQSSGLFQNVLLYSGSILSSNYIQSNPRENAILLCLELGIDVTNYIYMMDQLKHVSPFDIVRAQEAIGRMDPQRGFRIYTPFKPTVEVECGSAIITRSPLELIRKGEIRDVPVVIGFNDQEGAEILQVLNEEPKLIEKLNNNFELLIPEDIKYPQGSPERRNLAARIKNFYFNNGDISCGNIGNYVNLISDSQYTYSIDLFIKLFKEKRKSSVYYYVFAADTELNWLKAFENIKYYGAAHADDIGYEFLTSVTKPQYQCLSSTAKDSSARLLLTVKYFAYRRVPVSIPNIESWPETGQNGQHIVTTNFDSFPVYHRPIPERLIFWSSVYEEYFSYLSTNENHKNGPGANARQRARHAPCHPWQEGPIGIDIQINK